MMIQSKRQIYICLVLNWLTFCLIFQNVLHLYRVSNLLIFILELIRSILFDTHESIDSHQTGVYMILYTL